MYVPYPVVVQSDLLQRSLMLTRERLPILS